MQPWFRRMPWGYLAAKDRKRVVGSLVEVAVYEIESATNSIRQAGCVGGRRFGRV